MRHPSSTHQLGTSPGWIRHAARKFVLPRNAMGTVRDLARSPVPQAAIDRVNDHVVTLE
jgi:hypothetical protein